MTSDQDTSVFSPRHVFRIRENVTSLRDACYPKINNYGYGYGSQHGYIEKEENDQYKKCHLAYSFHSYMVEECTYSFTCAKVE